MSRISVVIADDHAVVREGLAMIIHHEPDLLLAAQAADGEQALAACHAHQPNVALIDLRMPKLGGMALIRRLHSELPRVRVVVLSSHEQNDYVQAALREGARGYVAKRSGKVSLLAAIRAVHAGELFCDEQLSEGTPMPANRVLSEREREVADLIARGHTNREMAGMLGVSKSSIDTYRARVLDKLGAENRAELIVALKQGDRPDGE